MCLVVLIHFVYPTKFIAENNFRMVDIRHFKFLSPICADGALIIIIIKKQKLHIHLISMWAICAVIFSEMLIKPHSFVKSGESRGRWH